MEGQTICCDTRHIYKFTSTITMNTDYLQSSNSAEKLSIGQRIKKRLLELIDLGYQRENEHFTIETIKEDVDFRGSRIWILVCAILIASLGLNVNSTAVIIGAMLISPLMGPIIGFGLGLGISDFELIKRSLRNLALITLFSVLTATIYFVLTPLSKAQSELLARTTPTVYDVLIAFVGGVAGMVAIGSRNKGNVATGVAIATALMPPLCTAGYGLSQLNWSFFFGAFYLYIINSVFIGLGTYVMVRALKFPRKAFIDKERERHIRRLVTFIAVSTIMPSIYFAFLLVQDSVREDGAHRFVSEHLSSPRVQVIRERLSKSRDGYSLEVVLLGKEFEETYIDSISTLMPRYGLDDTKLIIKQGFEDGKGQELNVDELRSVVLQDLYANSERIIKQQQREIDSLKQVLSRQSRYSRLSGEVNAEARMLFPEIDRITFAPAASAESYQDSVLIVLVDRSRKLSAMDEKRFDGWLLERSKAPKLNVIYK